MTEKVIGKMTRKESIVIDDKKKLLKPPCLCCGEEMKFIFTMKKFLKFDNEKRYVICESCFAIHEAQKTSLNDIIYFVTDE
jgi:hypothetical protein